MIVPITDFAALPHVELERMLRAGDPASEQAAGDLWRQVVRSLGELSDDVHRQLVAFAPYWRGAAADEYKIMMTEFVDGVDGVAGLLTSTRDLVYSAADALRRAQAQMPASVGLPVLSDMATTMLTWPAPAAVTLWDGLSEEQQLRLAEELRTRKSLSERAAVATSGAVAVMNELAVHYLTIIEAMPALPVAGESPEVPATAGEAELLVLQVDQQPAASGAPTTTPLFGDMFTAGSLAASGAVLGTFQVGAQWLERRQAAKAAAVAGGAALSPSSPPAGAGGGSGGGSGGGFGGGGLGVAADLPRASAVLAGAGGAGAVANPALLSTLPSAGLSGTGTSMGSGAGMMPPMYPPMGGGDGGMARRPPQWLVETEPVFGEAVPVTPAVIGELPPEPPVGRGWRPTV